MKIKTRCYLLVLMLFGTIVSSCEKDYIYVTDIDGNVYHTVKIGTQLWMVENLKTTHYCNGDPIYNVINDTLWGTLTSGAFCNYNNNEEYGNYLWTPL